MNKSALIALLRQKKVFIPAAIIVCILIVITIWSFFIPLPKNSSGVTLQQPIPSGAGGQQHSTTVIAPTITPQVTQQAGTLYKSTQYSIAYPPGWNITSQPVVTGGSSNSARARTGLANVKSLLLVTTGNVSLPE